MRNATNYVKAGRDLFFFFSNTPESAQDAYDLARKSDMPLSIYQVTTFAGPWDKLDIIGHRGRAVILQELGRTVNEDNRYWLGEELQAINACYREVGRMAPMTSVAA